MALLLADDLLEVLVQQELFLELQVFIFEPGFQGFEFLHGLIAGNFNFFALGDVGTAFQDLHHVPVFVFYWHADDQVPAVVFSFRRSVSWISTVLQCHQGAASRRMASLRFSAKA
jgi:hypothetical protein